MAVTRTLQRSFAGGEIAPEMSGRLDLDKYQTGLLLCRNFIALPHGPSLSRGGLQFINEAGDSTHPVRLISFSYNNEQTYNIEFGHEYIRFHSNGATLLETAKDIEAISQADPGIVTITGHGWTAGDWVFSADIGGMTPLNGRFFKLATVTSNTFTLTDLWGEAIDTTDLPAFTGDGTFARVYTLESPYDAADLFRIHFTQSADVLTLAHPGYPPKELRRLGASDWDLADISYAPKSQPPATVTVENTTGSGSTQYEYVVTTLTEEGLEESYASPGATRGGIISISAITQANPGVITTAVAHGLVVNNRIYVDNVGGMTQLTPGFYLVNTRPSTTTLTLKTLAGVVIDTTLYAAYTGGGTIRPTGVANITAITQANPGVLTTDTAHGLAAGDRCYVDSVGGMVELKDGYYIVNTAPNTVTLTLKTLDGVIADTTGFTAFTSGGTVRSVGVKNDLGTGSNKNTVSWPAVDKAKRYNVYRRKNGLFGYIGQTGENTFVDDNITPDVLRTPPEGDSPFPAAGDYPGAVGYYGQRRIFGGTDNRPNNGWLTRPGTEGNMTSSIPTQEDDAISIALKASQQNRIQHIVALSELIFLTSGAEWKIGTVNTDALTPSSIDPRPQSYVGCSTVQPVVTADSCLFVQGRGSHIRELTFSWEKNKFTASDISIMAPHLFRKRRIVDLAYSTAPQQVLWCVRDDGQLLGMTYVPEHQVIAWHHHDTQNGFVESVSVVAEDNIDAVYLLVRREINGRTVRYIERMADRDIDTVQEAFCVDAGAIYNGEPISEVTGGLWHLEGQTVSILADGAVQPQGVVQNGRIQLEVEASRIHIGLPMTCDWQMLPLTIEAAAAFGRGMVKNVNQVFIGVDRSSGIFAGPSFAALDLTEVKQRKYEDYGEPPELATGEIELVVEPTWTADGGACIRQTDPLPLTIVYAALEVVVSV